MDWLVIRMKIEFKIDYSELFNTIELELYNAEEDEPTEVLVQNLIDYIAEFIEYEGHIRVIVGRCPHCYAELTLADLEQGLCSCGATLRTIATTSVRRFLLGNTKQLV